MARKPQSTEDKYAVIGIAVGVLIATIFIFMFATHAVRMVRYLILGTGLVVGWFVGRAIGRSKPDR